MLNSIKKWIVERLGGRILTAEQKQVLYQHEISTINDRMRKKMDIQYAEMLLNGFATTFPDEI